jgi:hypothetical protein
VTASAWDDPTLTGSVGDRIADNLRDMVRAYENSRDRSQQTAVGPSEIGKSCTRCLARAALGMRLTRDFDDPWCRIIGTAVHEWLECAAHTHNTAVDQARYLTETRVQPHPDVLPRGGSADLYDEDTATVIDHKVVGPEPLRKYRLNGPGAQYRTQGHLYGLGFHRLGKRVENVAIAFWQRGGRLSDLYVWTEPFDAQIALDAIDRYRTIRDQALALGPSILPHLPADPACWDCGGKDVSADELAVINNPAQTIPA